MTMWDRLLSAVVATACTVIGLSVLQPVWAAPVCAVAGLVGGEPAWRQAADGCLGVMLAAALAVGVAAWCAQPAKMQRDQP